MNGTGGAEVVESIVEFDLALRLGFGPKRTVATTFYVLAARPPRPSSILRFS